MFNILIPKLWPSWREDRTYKNILKMEIMVAEEHSWFYRDGKLFCHVDSRIRAGGGVV
jgi:hypothetical protein